MAGENDTTVIQIRLISNSKTVADLMAKTLKAVAEFKDFEVTLDEADRLGTDTLRYIHLRYAGADNGKTE